MSSLNFGKFFREKRLQQKLTLRSYCKRFGCDTAYISRLENNKLKPPSAEKLKILAKTLGISKNTKDWVKFFDLAHQAKSEVPTDIIENAREVLNMLPAFLRTTDGQRVSKRKINQLVKFLQGQDNGKEK